LIKRFVGLPFDKPSPDHSTLSRFRGRISKKVMMKLSSGVLREFEKRGLRIKV